MEKRTISDYTEAVLEFDRLTENPEKNGIIYHPKDGQDDSPKGIVKEVKE